MSFSPALRSIALAISLVIPTVAQGQPSGTAGQSTTKTSLKKSSGVVSPSGGISIGRNTTRAKLAQNAQTGGTVNGTPGAPNNTIPGGAPGIPPNTQDSPNNPPQTPPYNAPGTPSYGNPPYNNAPQGVPSNPPGTPPNSQTGSPPTTIPVGTPGAIPPTTPGSPSFNTPGSAGSSITPGAPAGSAGAAGGR